LHLKGCERENTRDARLNEDFDALIGAAAMPRGLADKRVTESMDLTGRVAVVTGGGGINMGSACVVARGRYDRLRRRAEVPLTKY